MPKEQFGNNLTLIINIENLKSNTTENFDLTLEEMKFDFSKAADYERYSEFPSESGKKDFE